MTSQILLQLLEHHNWANLQILAACGEMLDTQLDHQPDGSTHGTIRETLHHFILSQEDYVSLLTTLAHPAPRKNAPTFAELRHLLLESGNQLLAYIQSSHHQSSPAHLQLTDGYQVAPSLFFVQVINHAAEHREQIKSMMTAQGFEPPRIDGWMFGREHEALIDPAE